VHLEQTVSERTQELHISNEKLRQAIHELDSFIYRTAHDIRGPLARLMGLCHVAILDVEDTKALDYFDKLNANAHNLDYILNRLSTVYEINHSDLHPVVIDFAKLQRDLEEKIRFAEGFHSVQYHVEISPDIQYQTDHDLLLFIIRNLLENAIKFQNPQNKVSFVLLKIRKNQKNLVVQVIDNGIGINPEDAPRIFDLFSRAAGQHQSVGMGLYMVKQAASKLHGTVALIERPKGITEFRVVLPFSRQASIGQQSQPVKTFSV
jgi:signal transduction histidine kinase